MIAAPSIALAGVLSWASGFRLYAALFLAGMLDRLQWVHLPPALAVLSHTPVLIATGALLVIEFLMDKVPAVDSAWGGFAHATPEVQAIAAILGGALAAGTHVAKAGTRALVNTSPEPFSNWGLSFSEDGVLLAGMWLAFAHPVAFLVLLGLFVLALVWLLPKLWRGVLALRRGLTRLFSRAEAGPEAPLRRH